MRSNEEQEASISWLVFSCFFLVLTQTFLSHIGREEKRTLGNTEVIFVITRAGSTHFEANCLSLQSQSEVDPSFLVPPWHYYWPRVVGGNVDPGSAEQLSVHLISLSLQHSPPAPKAPAPIRVCDGAWVSLTGLWVGWHFSLSQTEVVYVEFLRPIAGVWKWPNTQAMGGKYDWIFEGALLGCALVSQTFQL